MVHDDASASPTGLQLRALAVLVPAPPTRAVPLPHLAGYASRHSFLGGLLVDRTCARAALDAFLVYALGQARHWHAIVLKDTVLDGPQAGLLHQCARARALHPFILARCERAVLRPQAAGEAYLASRIASRMKALRRSRRRLEDEGPVSWSIHRRPEGLAAVIERHLLLEHAGWKGDGGSSLLSTPQGAQFFREVFAAFGRDGQALFTELAAQEQVVASTSNLVSGGAGFAFKVGWDPAHAKVSPGQLNEVELIRHAPQVCADLACIDSGASPGSFIESLWLERRALGNIALPLTLSARMALMAVGGLRWVRRHAVPRRTAPAR